MSPRRTDAGFALLAALSVLVAVGVLAVSFQAESRAERRATANALAAARAGWAARAGLARALHDLDGALRGLDAAGFNPVGPHVLPPLHLRENGTDVRVAILDTRAAVNLNRADPAQIERLLRATGATAAESRRQADAIATWRAQRAAAWPEGEDAFLDAADLRLVPALTSDTHGRLHGLVTAAGDGRINVNAAPAAVLASIPALDSDAAARITERRRTAPFRHPYELLDALPAATRERVEEDVGAFVDRIAFGPRDLEIAAVAAVPGSPVTAHLSAVVHLQGGAAWTLERTVER